MSMRKITSLTALIAFVLLIMTSIILYIVPSGRVAYWAGWRLWSLSKEDWGAVHINLGALLLIAIILHVYFNWSLILSYMKSRAKKIRLFTADFNISLAVTLLVFFGTLAGLPPMNSIVNLGNAITDKANLHYGEPPYGHAELSPLSDFTYKVKADLNESLVKLEAAGIRIESPEQTMQEIADKNGVSPQQVFNVIKPMVQGQGNEMPEVPPGGTGNRTLAVICEQYHLNQAKIIQGLANRNISASAGQTMKEIALANRMDPHGVYAAIYALTDK